MKRSGQIFVKVLPNLIFTSLYKQDGLTDVLSASKFNMKVLGQRKNVQNFVNSVLYSKVDIYL